MSSLATTIILVEDDEDDYILTRDLLEQIRGGHFELNWVSTYDQAIAAMQSAPSLDEQHSIEMPS